MPELPEVETVKRGLSQRIVGKTIHAVEYDWAKSFPNDQQQVDAFMIGSQVTLVRRRAKVLIIELDSGYSVLVHLKMTGQLVFVGTKAQRFGAGHPNESLVGDLPDKSTRVTISFVDGSQLFFNDQRKFGWMKLLPTELIQELAFFKKVGPEPLEEVFTPGVLFERLQRRRRSVIKAALLDQSVLAGIGNIYADEALWGAQIHPASVVGDLSLTAVEQLHAELQAVLRLAIEKGGSTDRNYVNAEGKKGSYIDFARVFRREGLDCPRCSAIIVKSRVAGRGTHTCPDCQVLVVDVSR
jgi:formamidopyrimidine-DNA glycosylase